MSLVTSGPFAGMEGVVMHGISKAGAFYDRGRYYAFPESRSKKRIDEALELQKHGFICIALDCPVYSLRKEQYVCCCWKEEKCGKGTGKTPVQEKWQLAWQKVKPGEDDYWRLSMHQFNGRYPVYNIGAITGPEAGRIVIDVDVADGKPGAQSLVELEAKLGALPPTVEVITHSGGRQFWLASTAQIQNSKSKLAPAIDIRGIGGQAVLPPSIGYTLNRYAWAPGRAPGEVDCAPLPDAWRDYILSVSPADEEKTPEEKAASAYKPSPVSSDKARDVMAALLEHPVIKWALTHPDDLRRDAWRGIANNLAALALECPELEDELRKLFKEISAYSGSQRYRRAEHRKEFSQGKEWLSEGRPTRFQKMVEQGMPEELVPDVGDSLAEAIEVSAGIKTLTPFEPATLSAEQGDAIFRRMVSHPAVIWALKNRGTAAVTDGLNRAIASNFAALALDAPSVEPALRTVYSAINTYPALAEDEFDTAKKALKTKLPAPAGFEYMKKHGLPEDHATGGTNLLYAARARVWAANGLE